MTMFRKTHERVGCLPYYVDERGIIKLLFMKPSDARYGGSHFQLCKGKMDVDGESLEEVARREAEEELGLVSDNILSFYFLLSDVAHHASGRKTLIHLFAAKVMDPAKLVPFGYETGEVVWYKVSEAVANIRNCHRPFIFNAVEKIVRTEWHSDPLNILVVPNVCKGVHMDDKSELSKSETNGDALDVHHH